MRINSYRPGRGIVYTLLTDVLFTLLAFYMMKIGVKSRELVTIQVVASQVPGLEKSITGYQGKLLEVENILANAHKKGRDLRSVIDGKETEIGDLKKVVGKVHLENGALKGKVQELEGDIEKSRFRSGAPFTLLVVIDITQSMTEPLEALREAIAALFEVLPNTSKDFRVAVLAMRHGVVARYEVTQILPTYEDEGRSQATVLDFLDSLEVQKSHTDHLPVFREAIGMLSQAHSDADSDRRIRLLFCGDVGTSEVDEKPGYSAEERKIKNRILNGVKKWTTLGNHAVTSLYAESKYTEQDPSSDESREWFKALGSVSPQSHFYSDSSEMLRAVFRASRE